MGTDCLSVEEFTSQDDGITSLTKVYVVKLIHFKKLKRIQGSYFANREERKNGRKSVGVETFSLQ